jgi:hypothetical protein
MHPSPLDYASPHRGSVSDVRFRPIATLLILANLLAAAAAGFVALIYLDRLGTVSAFLIVAALITAVAVFGFLTRAQPRFGMAALLLTITTAVAAAAFVRANADHASLESDIVRNASSPVVVVYIETERGARFATLDIARYVAGTHSALGSILLVYALYRYARLTRIKPSQPPPARPPNPTPA